MTIVCLSYPWLIAMFFGALALGAAAAFIKKIAYIFALLALADIIAIVICSLVFGIPSTELLAMLLIISIFLLAAIKGGKSE